MAKHKKPTTEELEENLKKIKSELDTPEKEEEKEEEEVAEKEPEKETNKEEEPEEEVEEEKEEENTEEEPEEEPEPSPDYKKKFSESSKEAQKIYAKNRKLDQAIDQANEIPDPTEDELKNEYSDWDIMSDSERRLSKEALISKRFRELIIKAREEAKKIEKWAEEVDKFADSPKTLIDYPELEGKTPEFVEFATSEKHNSVPFNLLVSAFLYEKQKGTRPKKGKMFETGTGGPNQRPKPPSNKISIDQARQLMKTDYKKYKEYLLAGKIDSSGI